VKKTVLAFSFLVLITPAFADTIPGLFSTGVDGSGTPLTNIFGDTDTHYTILAGPGILSAQSAVTYDNAAYIAEEPSGTNGNSRWISVNANGSSAGSGTYDFETTFDLTGFDPSTAQITGRFAGDNHITGTLINGTSVASATSDTFVAYTSFSITSGFVAGLNTLEFFVTDDGAPMALRVDALAGTASPIGTGPGPGTGVPEPGTVVLLATACLATIGLKVRSKKTA
jgi:hypothetical protein